MDYKYIEQLLERYWQCETSVEEEEILRSFFSQKDVPTELSKYRSLFAYEQTAKKVETLGDDFDAKILSIIDEPAPVKAKVISMRHRLMPLYKAAAVVAIVITLGNAAQLSVGGSKSEEEINYSSYKDTYSDPTAAYNKVQNALELVSEGINQSQNADTIASNTISVNNDSLRKE